MIICRDFAKFCKFYFMGNRKLIFSKGHAETYSLDLLTVDDDHLDDDYDDNDELFLWYG